MGQKASQEARSVQALVPSPSQAREGASLRAKKEVLSVYSTAQGPGPRWATPAEKLSLRGVNSLRPCCSEGTIGELELCLKAKLSFSAIPQLATRTSSSCICLDGGLTLWVLFNCQCPSRPETRRCSSSLHQHGTA